MVIALIIILPVMCIVTGLFTAWGIYTGLKWQIQTQQGQEPAKPMEVHIPDPFKAKREEKAQQDMANVLDEYLNGPKEGK